MDKKERILSSHFMLKFFLLWRKQLIFFIITITSYPSSDFHNLGTLKIIKTKTISCKIVSKLLNIFSYRKTRQRTDECKKFIEPPQVCWKKTDLKMNALFLPDILTGLKFSDSAIYEVQNYFFYLKHQQQLKQWNNAIHQMIKDDH